MFSDFARKKKLSISVHVHTSSLLIFEGLLDKRQNKPSSNCSSVFNRAELRVAFE